MWVVPLVVTGRPLPMKHSSSCARVPRACTYQRCAATAPLHPGADLSSTGSASTPITQRIEQQRVQQRIRLAQQIVKDVVSIADACVRSLRQSFHLRMQVGFALEADA